MMGSTTSTVTSAHPEQQKQQQPQQEQQQQQPQHQQQKQVQQQPKQPQQLPHHAPVVSARPMPSVVRILPGQSWLPNWVFGRTTNIQDYFTFGKNLGAPGFFGEARRVVEKSTGVEYAAKLIKKHRFSSSRFEDFRAEVSIMEKVTHPHVVKIHSVFEDETYLYLVMELCRGGELFDRIQVVKIYTEKVAVSILKQIFQALEYLHKNGIAHCDLKPDNFLFLDGGDDKLKIIDFGLSKFFRRRQYFTSFCGTSFYVAPEVCKKPAKFNEACDLWSMGVITFILLFGFPPFHHPDNDEIIYAKIQQGFSPVVQPGFGPWFPEARPCSPAARDFINKLLRLNVAERMTASEALSHPFLKDDPSDVKLDPSVLEGLRTFHNRPKLKTSLLRLMTDQLSDHEVVLLDRAFSDLDSNKDGAVSHQELKHALERVVARETKEGKQRSIAQQKIDEEVAKIMEMTDFDHDGSLSYEELRTSYTHRKVTAKEERLVQAFRRFDLDGNGRIQLEELVKLLATIEPTSVQDVKMMLAEVDTNKDGTVDMEEFLHMMWEKDYESSLRNRDVKLKPNSPLAPPTNNTANPTSSASPFKPIAIAGAIQPSSGAK